ncbi:hypothetical protein Slin15195_G061110 [Septoria linicola]|uniref:Uncharacterized protein n=1 Tax=Septoria linicola TaxID=215465 RepID=A0A9Q9ANL6_9PEZI|nr:hypothetical protein Slin14017_G076910 [Septoria linicola]USW52792.1 hypothetical protein Slin15195_G061110 [Septoria linicola]
MSSFSASTLVMLLGASTAFAQAQYPNAAAGGDACATACVTAYRACQGGPDANQSFCASQLASCVGYVPFDNSGSFVTPTACSATATATLYSSAAPTHGAGGDSCATACVTAYRACQGGPDANQSFCASQLASCVGYVPFDNSGSFVTPTACSATATATPYSSAAPTYGAGGDSCASDCVTKFRTCQSDLSNTRAQCASDLSTCVGYIPFDNSGSFVTPTACSKTATATPYSSAAPTYGAGGDSCASDCVTKFRTCQSDLSNTRAQCASDLSTCVGYIPFDNSGSFVTPTACSKTASATATTTQSGSAAPTYGAGGDSCASDCVTKFRTCQSDLSNTRAQCASDLSTCVGYIPFDNSGSFVTPTACSKTASATATATQSGSAAPSYAKTTGAVPHPSATGSFSSCAANCVTAFRTCQSNLNNTRAQCASDLATCVGYNPFDNNGTFVTPTSCAGGMGGMGGMGSGNKTATATMSRPAVYTGAAAINLGGPLAALAAGAVALMI